MYKFLTELGAAVTFISSVSIPPTLAQADSLLSPIVKDLQQQTSVPVRLPQQISNQVEPRIYTTIWFAEPTGYGINLDFTPDCLGARSCNYGTFVVQLASDSGELLAGERVLLAQNKIGYFTDYMCNGAGCSDARLIWDQNGYRYYVEIKAGQLESLVTIANSVIDSHPIAP